MNRAFGVTVTIPPLGRGKAQVQPWVVVARDAEDAAVVAVRACCSAAAIDAETFRELSDDEIREHALDLGNHGMAKALPTLEL
jgi:CRP-like cAMP-binding protein